MKQLRSKKSFKDLLLLAIAGIACSIFAAIFWYFFGNYGFMIVALLISGDLWFKAYNQRKKR